MKTYWSNLHGILLSVSDVNNSSVQKLCLYWNITSQFGLFLQEFWIITLYVKETENKFDTGKNSSYAVLHKNGIGWENFIPNAFFLF